MYILYFVSAVTPEEISRNKEVSKSDLFSSGVPSPEAVDELHMQLTEPCVDYPSTSRYGANRYNNYNFSEFLVFLEFTARLQNK